MFFLFPVEWSLDKHTLRFIQYGIEDNTMGILTWRMTMTSQLLHHCWEFKYINQYVYVE